MWQFHELKPCTSIMFDCLFELNQFKSLFVRYGKPDVSPDFINFALDFGSLGCVFIRWLANCRQFLL